MTTCTLHKKLPDESVCRNNRVEDRLYGHFGPCGKCGRVLAAITKEKTTRGRRSEGQGLISPKNEGSTPSPAPRIPEVNAPISSRDVPRRTTVRRNAEGRKNAQGEKNVSHTSRPGTAGDKRASKQPLISSGRLDQDRPGDVPHIEKGRGQTAQRQGHPSPIKSKPHSVRYMSFAGAPARAGDKPPASPAEQINDISLLLCIARVCLRRAEQIGGIQDKGGRRPGFCRHREIRRGWPKGKPRRQPEIDARSLA